MQRADMPKHNPSGVVVEPSLAHGAEVGSAALAEAHPYGSKLVQNLACSHVSKVLTAALFAISGAYILATASVMQTHDYTTYYRTAAFVFALIGLRQWLEFATVLPVVLCGTCCYSREPTRNGRSPTTSVTAHRHGCCPWRVASCGIRSILTAARCRTALGSPVIRLLAFCTCIAGVYYFRDWGRKNPALLGSVLVSAMLLGGWSLEPSVRTLAALCASSNSCGGRCGRRAMYQSIMLAQIERELASPSSANRRKPTPSKSSTQQARVFQAEPFSNAFAPLTVAFLNARRCTLETGAIDVDATANAVQQAMPRASVAVLLEVCRSAKEISRAAPDRPAGLTATEKEGGEDQVARLAAATGMYAAFCPVEYETRIRWGRGTVGRVGSRTDQLCTGHVVLSAWPPLAVRRVNLPWRCHASDDWGGPTHQAGIAVAVQPPGWSRAVWVVAGAASPDASGHAQWLQAAAMLGWISQLPPFVPKASEQLALAGNASSKPAAQSRDAGLHRSATAASCGYVLDPSGDRIATDTDTQSLGSVLVSSLFSLLGAVLCGVGSITRSAACCYRCGTAGGGCCPRPYSPLLDDDAEPHASAGVCAPGRQAKEVGLVADNVVLCWDSATPGSAAPARLLGSAGLARASGVAPKLRGCTTLLMCRSRAAGVDGGGFWNSFGVWRRLSCRWVTDTASGLRSYQAAHKSLPAPGQPPEWDRTVVCHSCWRCRAVHQPSPVDSEGMYVAAGGALGVADYTLRAPADVKLLGPVAARAADMPGMPPLLHPLHVLTLIPRAQVTEMATALKCA